MIELACGDLGLKLDPAHGAEIVGLTDLRSGVQLLGLARATAAGQAWWAKPGERDGYKVTLHGRQDHPAQPAAWSDDQAVCTANRETQW
jgi:hypothetical protein